MHTLRCIAIDDEPLALELLEDNIRKVPFLMLVASASNAMDAMRILQSETIDLVFSDIQMPGLSGLQFIESLQVKPLFILISAHEKFALESYNLDVVDYLLKPVAYERFLKACNKAQERYTTQLSSQKSNIRQEKKEFIFLPVDYKMVKVDLQDVTMMEAVRDYVRIHFQKEKKPLLVRISMKAMEEMLSGTDLIRIHKSFIVSIKYIIAIRKNSVFVNDEELPVGEQYRDAVIRLAEGY